MTTVYKLKTANFEGPLEKLLELIEAKDLPITSVSMAEVTADFLEYIKQVSQINKRVLADFIAVASRLILIKSHTLLPQLPLSEEEEEDISDLENRLKIYKELKSAEKNIEKAWSKNSSFGRDYLLNIPSGFYLSQTLSSADMLTSLLKILDELEAFAPKEDKGLVVMVNFQEKLKELIKRIDNKLTSSFNEIVSGREKKEIIVMFLALLHLLKDNMVNIEQSGGFGDITITKLNDKQNE